MAVFQEWNPPYGISNQLALGIASILILLYFIYRVFTTSNISSGVANNSRPLPPPISPISKAFSRFPAPYLSQAISLSLAKIMPRYAKPGGGNTVRPSFKYDLGIQERW
jgi:hypothetical protein